MYCDQCGQFWELCTCEDEPHISKDLLNIIDNDSDYVDEPYVIKDGSINECNPDDIKHIDYAETEKRVLVLVGGCGAGRASLVNALNTLNANLHIMDEAPKEHMLHMGMDFGNHEHSIQALIKYDAENRYNIEDIKDLPRLDRPHYRTLEKINKKSRYK